MQQKTEQPPQPQSEGIDLSPLFSGPLPWLIGTMALILIALWWFEDETRREPDDARWASTREQHRAKMLGLQQIRNQKRDEIALRLGSDNPLILPDLQPLVTIVGGSGKGKTATIIELALADAIRQGHTLIVFDVKGTLKRKFIPYALKQRIPYDTYCFAPGKLYSNGFDFLGFMRDPDDSTMARSIASALSDNVIANISGKHPFFDNHAEYFLQALLMMAKRSDYADLPMVWALMGLSDIAERIQVADDAGEFRMDGDLGMWAKQQLTGLSSVTDTKDTAGGILASGINYLLPMVNRQTIPCLSRDGREPPHSTIPLDLPGPQIVFFELDGQAKKATAPLVAVAIHLLIQRNLNENTHRDRPFGVFLDEFARLMLPSFEEMVSLDRSYGFYSFVSMQSYSQPKIKYKPETSESIFDNTSTQFIFKSGSYKVREDLSADLGEYTKHYHSKSRSYGGKSGNSRSRNEQEKKKRLITASDIKRLKKGEFICTNSGMDDRPIRMRFNLKRRNKTDMQRFKECEQMYDSHIHPQMLRIAQERVLDPPELILTDRMVSADAMLPTAKEVESLELKQQETAK
ncbi:type IV secretory system conjugative DNA transfer family protein [Acaryochloris marina NIES-2412]|uniref:type IV secretory system conjugative DNA transfer family protein n=1 Tax=Acaryochloris marina TaxID=155978 RepID=UPI0040580694